jgi:hypothetical protein
MAVQETINIGALPNDGDGDPLRTAFGKINNNFSVLFSSDFSTSEAYSVGNTSSQIIFQTPALTFTQGVFQINSQDLNTANRQNITLVASSSSASTVKWNGHSTLFTGSPLTAYDIDISGSNVRILVNPLVNSTIFHFISAQVTTVGETTVGLDLELDGYTAGDLLSTENSLDLSTET